MTRFASSGASADSDEDGTDESDEDVSASPPDPRISSLFVPLRLLTLFPRKRELILAVDTGGRRQQRLQCGRRRRGRHGSMKRTYRQTQTFRSPSRRPSFNSSLYTLPCIDSLVIRLPSLSYYFLPALVPLSSHSTSVSNIFATRFSSIAHFLRQSPCFAPSTMYNVACHRSSLP